jgi:hypothetical protein
VLGRDIVGHLAVKILKTDRELSHCFVWFLADREELSELFSLGDFPMKQFEKLCAYDLKGRTLRLIEPGIPTRGWSIEGESELGALGCIEFSRSEALCRVVRLPSRSESTKMCLRVWTVGVTRVRVRHGVVLGFFWEFRKRVGFRLGYLRRARRRLGW